MAAIGAFNDRYAWIGPTFGVTFVDSNSCLRTGISYRTDYIQTVEELDNLSSYTPDLLDWAARKENGLTSITEHFE